METPAHPNARRERSLLAAVRCWLAVLLLAVVPLAAEASGGDGSLTRFLTNVEAMLDVPEADGEGERFDDLAKTTDAPAGVSTNAVLDASVLALDTARNGRRPGAHSVCAAPPTGPPPPDPRP